MPELTTVGLGAIAAYLGKDGISKLLGPTADYLGGELQEFAKRRIDNVGRIFQNAERKLSDNIEKPGQVPPKVLRTIINEGSYSEDDVAVEYFGGVLASSRTEFSRDDRGARIATKLDNLSTYQIRSHYLIYSTIKNLFKDTDNKFGLSPEREKMQIFIPFQGYYDAMGFTDEEWNNPQLLGHIFHGLDNDSLIGNRWQFGNQESLKAMFPAVPDDGLICQPSSSGVELFLWAFGRGEEKLEFIFDPEFKSVIEGLTSFVEGSITTK